MSVERLKGIVMTSYSIHYTKLYDECSSCHGEVEDFVGKSVAVLWGKVRGIESGIAVSEFLATHQELRDEDVEFFTNLLERFAEYLQQP